MNKWDAASGANKGLRQKLIHRADAFANARSGNGESIPALLDILAKRSEGPLVRANALGYLSGFPDDPRTFPTLVNALNDPEPLVRVYATLRISPRPADKDAAVAALERALSDSATTVRVGATVSLVSLGISRRTRAYPQRRIHTHQRLW